MLTELIYRFLSHMFSPPGSPDSAPWTLFGPGIANPRREVVAGVDEVLYRVIGRALGRRPTVREPGADEDPMRWYSAPDVSRSAIIAREELRRA
jgi:hypothetical protein